MSVFICDKDTLTILDKFLAGFTSQIRLIFNKPS